MSRPILTLSQPQASGLANELFRVVALDADDPLVTGKCGTCGGEGKEWKVVGQTKTLRDGSETWWGRVPCPDCSDGRVERLEPGSRVLIASNGEWTRDLVERWWESAVSGGREMPPRDSIVGSAVVEAVADIKKFSWMEREPFFTTDMHDGFDLCRPGDPMTYIDCSDQLPWLPAPADLVGKVAVLFTDPQVETA